MASNFSHPQSLPSNFQFPTTEDISNHPFFTNDANDDDNSSTPVLTVDNVTARTRLEVLKGWEVSFAILSLYAASFLALIYVLFISSYTASVWNTTNQLPSISTLEFIFKVLLEYASFALPIIFALHLAFSGHATDEQIWTLVLLAVGLFATNPLTNTGPDDPIHTKPSLSYTHHTTFLLRVLLDFPFQSIASDPHKRIILNDAVYTAVIYSYLILAANSYRVFDVKKIHSLQFYLPKLAVAFVYILVKVITGFQADVSLGLIPYSRILTWLFLESSGRGSLRVTVPVVATTIMDTAFAFWLIHEVARTAEFLATVPYVENRTKQLGFRCFVYQTIAFCFNIIGLSSIINWMLPRSYLYEMFDGSKDKILQLEPSVGRLGLAFVYFMWTVVLAYVNLPAISILPLLQQIISQCLFFLRSSRVAVWMGLADIVTTEEMEDCSDDGIEMMSLDSGAAHVTLHREQQKLPLRYRHRELLEPVTSSPQTSGPNMANVFNQFNSRKETISFAKNTSGRDDTAQQSYNSNSVCRNSRIIPSRSITSPRPVRPIIFRIQDSNDGFTQPSLIGNSQIAANRYGQSSNSNKLLTSISLPTTSSPPIDNITRRRVRLRKNLFVMETQVMLSNAAYLSYIPGNRKEEQKGRHPRTNQPSSSLLYTGSLSTNMDDLARQIEEEEVDLEAGRKLGADPETQSAQPDFDNGSMFKLDPYQMAERYGYRIYRHICDEALNTHAIVLLSSSRVIVAFSGTRNVTNWGINANLKRAVLDDKLTRFEYELKHGDNDNTEDHKKCGPDTQGHDYRKLKDRYSRRDSMWAHQARVRRCKSDDNISVDSFNSLIPECERSFYSYKRTGQNYGAINATGEQPPEWLSLEGQFRHARVRAQHSVGAVASTFAKELLTFGQAKVHEGFLNAYMSLRKKVMGTLIELYRGMRRNERDGNRRTGVANSLPVFFCGHSLGGALATFASYEAARYYKRIGISRRQDISCTTFGCPRIGNEAFKYRYERLVETHWRFEIASDPIPGLPHFVLNYVPVGVQVLIDQSGMLLIDPSFIEVQWWGRLANLYLGYRLHIRASYCMALKTYCRLYNNGSDDLQDKFWSFPIRVQTRGLFGQSRG